MAPLGMRMALHFSLALGCGSLAVAVIVEAVFRLVHHAAPSRLTVILEVAFEIFVTLAGLMGLLLFATGHRPKEMLHLLYGLIALGAIPVGDVIAMDYTNGKKAAMRLGMAVVALGVIVRLFMTG